MDKFIDVKKLIASKNEKLLGWLPGFVVRWVERIIHQKEVNIFMEKYGDSNADEFAAAVMGEFNLTLNLKGQEHIPSMSSSCIFASNHPLGGLDAIAIIHLFKEIRPDIKFIVNDLLLNLVTLREKFVGVNKVGKNAVASLQQVEEQFASNNATFLFPSGLVSRKTKGKIRDLDWKKTFITKSKKYKKPVVPVFINGRLTNRFYRLANVRKFFGIKLNIEMFYLVDELYRQKNVTIDITIGKPIHPESFTKSQSDKKWAQWVKEEVYKLNKA